MQVVNQTPTTSGESSTLISGSSEAQSLNVPLSAPAIPISVKADQVDYTFSIKMKWRQLWGEFLDRTVPKELRAGLKILCLPSAQVENEVKLYLDLGFRAENITGVEGGGEEARSKFLVNAARFGINPVIGRLEDLTPQFKDPFDIVSYDFVGPFSESSKKILEHTPIAERAWILTNFMGAREPGNIQGDIRHRAQSDFQAREHFESTLSGIVTTDFLTSIQEWNKQFSIADAESASLKKLREDWIEQQAISHFGRMSEHYLNPRLEFLNKFGFEPQPKDVAYASGSEDTLAQLARLVSEFIAACNPSGGASQQTRIFSTMYRALVAFYLRSHGDEVERYCYRSQASEKGTWFFSQFSRLSPLHSFELLTGSRTAKFFAHLLEGSLPNPEPEDVQYELQLRDRSGAKVDPRAVRRNYEITLLKNGRLSAWVTARYIQEWLENLEKDGRNFKGYSTFPKRIEIK